MATRLKVEKAVLLKKLRDERRRQTEKHKLALDLFDGRLALAAERVAVALEGFAAQLRANPAKAIEKTSTSYQGDRLTVPCSVAVPSRPTLNTGKLDRLIRVLESSTDETISVSTDDDWAAYL